MSEEKVEFITLGLLKKLNEQKPAQPKQFRKWEARETKNPETKAFVAAHRERQLRLITLSTKKPFPPCPRCGSMLVLEDELLGEHRLVCFSSRHSVEVVKKVGSTFWIPAHFFTK